MRRANSLQLLDINAAFSIINHAPLLDPHYTLQQYQLSMFDSTSLTGCRLALDYSIKSNAGNQTKLKDLQLLLIKQRMRNQEHVQHIEKLKHTIHLKNSQIETLNKKTARLEVSQRTLKAEAQQIIRKNGMHTSKVIERLRQIEGGGQNVQGEESNNTKQEKQQMLSRVVFELLESIEHRVKEEAAKNDRLRRQVQTKEAEIESQRGQIERLSKQAQDQSEKETVMRSLQDIVRASGSTNSLQASHLATVLLQIVEDLRVTTEGLLQQV